MNRLISITTAAQLAQALEDWMIDNKCNPQTPEEWEKCMNDLIKNGSITPVGTIEEKDVPELKKGLQNNFNVEDLDNGNS